MKQCVSCLKYSLHTISTLWAEVSFSLTLWSEKCSLNHYQYAISIFPEIFFFWHLVINGQFMLIVQITGLGPSGSTVCSEWTPLPYATWCFEHCCSIFPESYRLFLTEALWRNAYLKCWLGSDQKATLTVSPLYFLISFFVFFPCISVVRCCCESSFMKITCHVTFAF